MLWRVSRPSEPVPSLPASSCLASLRWRTGHLPDPVGSMRSSSTGIGSLPGKTAIKSAFGPGRPATIRRRSRGSVMPWPPCQSIAPYWTARPSCCDLTSRPIFEGLCSRHGQADAVLVAYDVMEVDGKSVRPEALEERRKRLRKLLSRSNKALREGIQLSEAITGDGAAIFRHACGMGLEGIVSKREV